MGNTCKPMAVLFQCMTKSTTKKKKTNFPSKAVPGDFALISVAGFYLPAASNKSFFLQKKKKKISTSHKTISVFIF